MIRPGTSLVIVTLLLTSALAGENDFIMNFDLVTKRPDGSVEGSIQLQGIHLVAGKPFHGSDLGRYEYFLTVSGVEDGECVLTIEFYEYKSRKKVSDVVSEIVAEVSFEPGRPAVFQGNSDTFTVDLAFSINQKSIKQTTECGGVTATKTVAFLYRFCRDGSFEPRDVR